MEGRVIKKIKRKQPKSANDPQFKLNEQGKMIDENGEEIEFEDDSDDLEDNAGAQYMDEQVVV
jgi:hypothetical protein